MGSGPSVHTGNKWEKAKGGVQVAPHTLAMLCPEPLIPLSRGHDPLFPGKL